MILVDGHQDLAWNMLTFGRDYTRSAHETRRLEAGSVASVANGDTLLGWPDYQRGRVAVVFSTLFAAPKRWQEFPGEPLVYEDYNQAHQLYRAQLDRYNRLVDDHPDKFRLIFDRKDLKEVLAPWRAADQMPPASQTPSEERPESRHSDQEPAAQAAGNPVGMVVLMEGAEGVRTPAELEDWWQRGVRLIGPAWAGTRYCGGSREPGPLTSDGFALLEAMSGLGFTLDLSHMDEKAALQALDAYPGPVVATHSNALALLKGVETNRHLSDRVIQGLFERDGIVGVVLLNSFLKPGWRRGDRRQEVGLDIVVAQIDYLCQMAGDARHAGIGTDFDGGFGLGSTPWGIDTIADLHKIAPLLLEKGYSETDVAAVLGENWLSHLEKHLPESV